MNESKSRGRLPMTIGVVEGGGPVSEAIRGAFRDLARYIVSTAAETDGARTLSINIQYHIPGSIWPVDFAGVRIGRFIRQSRVQIVHVAVPSSLDGADAISEFIASSLEKAGAEAALALGGKGIHDQACIEAALGLIQRAASHLRSRDR